jgi:co-chaperonin GroES (HSP10)
MARTTKESQLKQELSQLKPLKGTVLVEFQPRIDRVTSSGIVMPEIIKHEGLPNRGKVLLVGSDIDVIEPDDFVHYLCDTPQSLRWAGKKIIIINIKDVIAKELSDEA